MGDCERSHKQGVCQPVRAEVINESVWWLHHSRLLLHLMTYVRTNVKGVDPDAADVENARVRRLSFYCGCVILRGWACLDTLQDFEGVLPPADLEIVRLVEMVPTVREVAVYPIPVNGSPGGAQHWTQSLCETFASAVRKTRRESI